MYRTSRARFLNTVTRFDGDDLTEQHCRGSIAAHALCGSITVHVAIEGGPTFLVSLNDDALDVVEAAIRDAKREREAEARGCEPESLSEVVLTEANADRVLDALDLASWEVEAAFDMMAEAVDRAETVEDLLWRLEDWAREGAPGVCGADDAYMERVDAHYRHARRRLASLLLPSGQEG